MPPKGRKRSRPSTGSSAAGKKTTKDGGKKTRANPEAPPEQLDLAVSETPQTIHGKSFVDFESILRNSDILGQSPELEKPDASASFPVSPDFRAAIGANDLEIMRCGGDEVSIHIPQIIKEKIWKNQYINLAMLLKGSVELEEICGGGTLKVTDSGIIEKQPKYMKDKVPNIEKWTDAFIIFMSIYLEKQPQKIHELLQYMSVIREAAYKYSGVAWRTYDEQYRIRQAIFLTSWAQINSDLWLRIMSNPSQASPTQSQVSHSSTTITQTKKLHCHGFNQGYCSWVPCKFNHCCSVCGQFSHGAWACRQQTSTFSHAMLPVQRGNFRGPRGGRFSRGRGGYTRSGSR